jgi:hypothetical protein
MLSSNRRRAALALALFSLAACGEETKLPTELDVAAVTEDIELTQAAFENQQTDALGELGFYIDNALVGFGGLPTSMASVVAAGPSKPSDPRSVQRMIERAEDVTGSGPMSSIPAAVLGKTLVWNTTTQQYELSNPAIAGAPANGVRFRLYQLDELSGLPAQPLVYVGYADISREGTVNAPAARLAVYTAAGTKVLEYLATVSGAQSVPSFRVEGTAGVGPNAATFSLTVGVNITNQTVTATWRTAIPARALTSRTTLGLSEETFTITGVMQRGLSKVEISGTLSYLSGGQLTVKVGNATFARITTDAEGNTTVTNPSGGALTPEEEATLEAIFAWFSSTFDWYGALLNPIYTVLDVPLN